LVSCFSVSCSAALRDLHSFPTRRSSDLSDSGQKGKVGLVYPGHTFSGVDVDRDRLGHTLLCQLLHELGVGLGQRQLEVVHQLVEYDLGSCTTSGTPTPSPLWKDGAAPLSGGVELVAEPDRIQLVQQGHGGGLAPQPGTGDHHRILELRYATGGVDEAPDLRGGEGLRFGDRQAGTADPGEG